MADFQEVTEQFQKMMDSVKDNPARLVDDNSVDFMKSIAISAAERSVSQKGYAKSVGEEFVIAKQLSLIERKRVVDAQLKSTLSESATEAANIELETIENLLDRNKALLDTIQEQTSDWGEAVGQVVKLDELERKRLMISLEAQENLTARVTLTEDEIELADQRLIQLADEDKILAAMQAKRKEMAARSALRNKQETVFGISQDKINSKIEEMGNLLSTTAGRITVIAAALKVVLTPVVAHLQELRKAGLTWSQTMERGLDTLKAMRAIGGIRGILTAKDTVEASEALARSFADLTFQSPGIIAVGSELTTAFKLSAEESAELVETLAKVGGLTAHAQENMMHTAEAFGKINKIRPGALLQAAARHASLFARFGEKGAQAFFRSVTAAQRLGIELSSIESSADQFLDIDTFFQDVSRLRTLGVNIADPFGLAEIAETGSPEEIANELSRQLEGLDLTELTRTQRNALSSAVGMDMAEISRLISGGGPEGAEERVGGVKTATEEQIEALGGFNRGLGGAVDALSAFVGMFGGLSSVLQGIVTLMGAQALLSGGKGMISGLLGRLGIGAAAGGAGVAGASTAAAAGGVGLAGGLAGGLGGLLAGAGVGTGLLELSNKFLGTEFSTLADFERIRRLNAEAEAQSAEARRLQEQNRPLHEAVARGASPEELARIREQIRTGETAPQAPEDVAQTATTTESSKIATKGQMEELLGFFRQGFVVNIDGRRAGQLIAANQPR